jgi:hypothetical protein
MEIISRKNNNCAAWFVKTKEERKEVSLQKLLSAFSSYKMKHHE